MLDSGDMVRNKIKSHCRGKRKSFLLVSFSSLVPSPDLATTEKIPNGTSKELIDAALEVCWERVLGSLVCPL